MYTFSEEWLLNFKVLEAEGCGADKKRYVFEVPYELDVKEDPLTKGINDWYNVMWQQIITDITLQNMKLKEEIESLKKEKEFPTKVDIPKSISFEIRSILNPSPCGIVRGDFSLSKNKELYTVNKHLAELGGRSVQLENCLLEDLKPGDIIFDDELSTEQLSDIENYGIILENMSVAFWCGLGVIVEPEIKTTTNQYYKAVIKK